ncbi:MAG: hypothetical protein JXR19_07495 [Bacteroidia bacterium]
MNIRKLTLTALTLLIGFGSYAQNIQRDAVEFGIIRYPSEPLQNFEGYQFTVNTPYPENGNDIVAQAKRDHELAVANYPATLAESKEKYEQELVNYDKAVEDARENYKLEMEEWNKLGKLEKMAMQDHMPKLHLPSKPTYREPYPPEYREPNMTNVITFNKQTLADAYLNIEGMQPSTETANVLVGHVEIGDFEFIPAVRKSEVESYYDKTSKTTKKRTVYYYEYSYKRPVYLTLTLNGETLHSGLYKNTGEFTVETSKSHPSMANIERETVTSSLEAINAELNDKHGYSLQFEECLITYVKNKKGEWDDLESATGFAKAGIGALKDNEMNEDLGQAMEIWKSLYAESNPDDKKSRINKKVTKALLYNMMYVSRMTNNYADAKMYLDALKALDMNYNDKVWSKEFEEKLIETERRLSINGLI